MKVRGNSKAVANCESPKCADCKFGKGHRQYNKLNTIKTNPMKQQGLHNDHLLPGQMYSQHTWDFHSWPLPWNFFSPLYALYELIIAHVRT